MMNLILFGPPGAGKGTQAKKISGKYNLMHISTGDILRNEIAQGTPLGLKVKEILDRGELVSDGVLTEILHSVFRNNPSVNGFIFDGFPRTIPQAEALDALLAGEKEKIHCVISLEVDEEELIKRLLNRALETGRADDNEEVIRKRLEVYHHHTKPLLDYYKNHGSLVPVYGIGSIEDIFISICNVI